MSSTRPPYPPEYREQIINLHRSGRTIASLARDFEPSVCTIRAWIRKANNVGPEKEEPVPAEDERAELLRLRKEVAVLKQEREILEKAAAWFAQKTVLK